MYVSFFSYNYGEFPWDLTSYSDFLLKTPKLNINFTVFLLILALVIIWLHGYGIGKELQKVPLKIIN